jgi:hypothetical protein
MFINSKSGFTLFEILIYIALFSIIILSTFIIAHSILQNSDSLSIGVTTQAEGNFVLRKIEWALSGVETIDAPLSGQSTVLRVTKYDNSQIDIQLGTPHIELRRGSGGSYEDWIPITTANVVVSSLGFTYIPASGNAPAGITASTTINGVSFVTTRYIRK